MKQRNILFAAVLLPLLLTLTYCSGKLAPVSHETQDRKEMANAKADDLASTEYGPEDKAPSAESRSLAGQVSTKDESQAGNIPFIFLSSNKYEGERLLEYQVNLSYETKDFVLSRKDFLDIVSKYGYLSYTTTGYSDLRYSMSAQFNIKVADIYRVVKELDKLGSLRYENTSVVDHTRDMAWNARKALRLQIREQRIARVVGQVAGENKNWKDREDALERSEDALDQAEQGKWDITDQVTWAKITVSVATPPDAAPVQIPTFRNALALLVNGFFKVLYVLVVVSPFIAVGGVIWWKRKKIIGIFARKKA
jgi:hypothetical protein